MVGCQPLERGRLALRPRPCACLPLARAGCVGGGVFCPSRRTERWALPVVGEPGMEDAMDLADAAAHAMVGPWDRGWMLHEGKEMGLHGFSYGT